MKGAHKSQCGNLLAVGARNQGGGSSFSNNGSNSKVPKTLTEHKSKRLSILTAINEHKHILFTKKAFKHEKEKIWRQIFTKMLDFGMVSKEKDWRYVRDVSFSNWRKRAQKRLKHLAANGYRLNMDECEFLIYDILGKTPDKTVSGDGAEDAGNTGGESTVGGGWMGVEEGSNAQAAMMMAMKMKSMQGGNRPAEGDDDEDESDEYMIDSDEDEDEEEEDEDEDDDEDEDEDEDVDGGSFDERLFVPKIVFSDSGSNNGGGGQNNNQQQHQQQLNNHESLQGNNHSGQRQTSENNTSGNLLKAELIRGKNSSIPSSPSNGGVLHQLLFNGNNHQLQNQKSNHPHPHQQQQQNRQFGLKYHHQNSGVSSTNNHHHQFHHPNQRNNNSNHSNHQRSPGKAPATAAQPSQTSSLINETVSSFDLDLETSSSSPNVRYVNKFRELRLLDLEIENKVLKNRYMKLKIFQLEGRLGLEHCKEVKEFKTGGGGNGGEGDEGKLSPKPQTPVFKNNNEQTSNGEQPQQSQQQQLNSHKVNNVGGGGPSANKKART